MGKALVVKGVNFSVNKLDTVNLSTNIPCTGLTLNESAITFIAFTTVQLTATKVPANTSDTVTWTSSNTNVATVTNGLVTCVGVGTATITAICGEQTATCSVSSTLTVVLEDEYYAENGARYSGSMDLSANPPKNHVGRTEDTRGRLYYSTTEYGTYRVFVMTSNAGKYAIPLPNGATKATITTIPTDMNLDTFFIIVDVNTKQTKVSGADGQSAMGIQKYESYSSSTYPVEFDFSDYAASANGYIVSVYARSGESASDKSGKTTIVFS